MSDGESQRIEATLIKQQKKNLILPMMNIPRVQKSISWPGGICSSVSGSIFVLMSETDGEAAFYSQPCTPQAPS